MSNVAVIGAQWGDEGKGKIVDWLSARADVVVRFQGGHNAGHTLVIDGVTYKLSLLPSGVVRPGKLSVIGNGVVVDPWAFADEIERVRIEHDAVADDRELARAHDARRQERELVGLGADDEGVAGVVAALETHDDVGLLGQPVDDLALALVAPLGADHHHVCHLYACL